MAKVGRLTCLVAALAAACAIPHALADDRIVVAAGQRGTWETAVPELGYRAGIFQKHGIKPELIYTQGAGETLQAIIPGSSEIGVGAGIMGVLRAYGRGAPVRIIGSEIKDNTDYLFVTANSPIRSLKDADGKTIAYTTSGSSSHNLALALIKQYGVKAQAVAAGNLGAIMTQVMSGHIDVGVASPPFGLDAVESGKIRIIARGSEALAMRDRTIRVVITNASTLQKRRDLIDRFLRAYQETIEWMYSDPAALTYYAEFAGISESLAKRVRDEFISKEALSLGEIRGLDSILQDAVDLKFLDKALTKEQVAELVQIAPQKR